MHQWRLQIEGPDCDECEYSAIVGLAACGCGELLAPTAIEQRLNAVERLSAETARAIWRKIDALSLELMGYESALEAYAAALEGDDDLSKLPTQQKLTAEDMESA